MGLSSVYVKPGGVPDKLWVFPADESQQARNSRCPGIAGSSSPTMTVFFFHVCSNSNDPRYNECLLLSHTCRIRGRQSVQTAQYCSPNLVHIPLWYGTILHLHVHRYILHIEYIHIIIACCLHVVLQYTLWRLSSEC